MSVQAANLPLFVPYFTSVPSDQTVVYKLLSEQYILLFLLCSESLLLFASCPLKNAVFYLFSHSTT